MNVLISRSSKRFALAFAAAALAAASGQAGAVLLNLPVNPLIVSNDVAPNVMFMVDNSGSMTNIVPDAPFNPATTYLASCPAANLVPAGTSVDLNVRTSNADFTPRIAYGGRVYTWGTATNQRCFDSASLYGARLFADSAGTTTATDFSTGTSQTFKFVGGGYLDADYRGNYLNWYFDKNSASPAVVWNGGQARKPVTATTLVSNRIEVARQAGVDLVNGLDSRLRVGLSTYNSGNGGTLSQRIEPLTPAKRTAMAAAINALTPGGNTPLAETLSDIGRYFAQGNSTNNLTLHPDGASSVATVVNTFNSHQFLNNETTPPISQSCQQNFAAVLTDGRPQGDRAIGAPLRDYLGDCAAGNCNAAINNSSNTAVTITAANRGTLQNGVQVGRNYEPEGSDYLDDVVKGLFDIDLRPDFPVEPTGLQFKNNIVSYMIGFADEQVLNDPLLRATGAAGGAGDIDEDGPGDGDGDGTGDGFLVASNARELANVFTDIITNILKRSASFSSAALNSTSLNANSRVFQAGFNSANWSGTLKSTRISSGLGSGPCPALGIGRPCPTAEWEASVVLDGIAPASRTIVTYKPSTRAGIPFRWANLDPAQQALLNLNPNVTPTSADTRGSLRLDFLRGDRSLEGALPFPFRVRDSLLGDIVNSDPTFVGVPNAALPFAGYSSFRAARRNRPAMVYAGSNDGMLHGFRVSDGRELLAYVPNIMYGTTGNPKLARLSARPFTHVFGVDGAATVGDIETGPGAWASYLVGSMRYGGQGIFALDVTDPSTFSEGTAANIVKWEFTDVNDADVGYTFSQPSIVKMKNGKWAAVFGNGYNSTEAGNASSSGQAALFIVFMGGPGAGGAWTAGTHYIKIPVGPSGSGVDNGLSTPAAVDLDGDSLIDYIYAGDLKGNMWQFNVNDLNSANWKAAYSAPPVFNPLFVATDHNNVPQPITGAPEVGANLLTADPDDLVVYFGSGRYIQTGDNSQTSQNNQTFYGIFANPIAAPGSPPTETTTSPNPARANLLEQFVLREVTVASGQRGRLTTQNTLDLATHKGWFIDLYNTQGGATTDAAAAGGLNKGERHIGRPILRDGRIVFTTLIPPLNPCDFGGSGWLMEIDARDGGRPRRPALDITGNLTVDKDDRFDVDGDGDIDDNDWAISGLGSEDGTLGGTAVLALTPGQEAKYSVLSDGSIAVFGEAASGRTGRLTWREIAP